MFIQRVLHNIDELQRHQGRDYAGGVLPEGRHDVYDCDEDDRVLRRNQAVVLKQIPPRLPIEVGAEIFVGSARFLYNKKKIDIGYEILNSRTRKYR